jgi:hypothetical protein
MQRSSLAKALNSAGCGRHGLQPCRTSLVGRLRCGLKPYLFKARQAQGVFGQTIAISLRIFLHTCPHRTSDRLFSIKQRWERAAWNTCTVYDATANSSQEVSRSLCTCLRRPWEYARAKNLRRSGYAFVLNAPSHSPWGPRRKVR